MKKLKFLLLTFLFISCLNSCFFLASFCADYGCMKESPMPKYSKRGPRGIYEVIFEKGYENYPEEILQRKKEYVEIENHRMLLPENTTLKKFRNALSGSVYNYSMGRYENEVQYYLYDKKRKVGFPLGFRFDKEEENTLSRIIEGKNKFVGKEGKHIYYRKSSQDPLHTYINRISEEVYITFGDYSGEDGTEAGKRVTNFLKELVKEWEK